MGTLLPCALLLAAAPGPALALPCSAPERNPYSFSFEVAADDPSNDCPGVGFRVDGEGIFTIAGTQCDAAGDVIKDHFHSREVDTITNLDTGCSLTWSNEFTGQVGTTTTTTETATLDDGSTATYLIIDHEVALVGVNSRIVGPGAGVLFLDAGRMPGILEVVLLVEPDGSTSFVAEHFIPAGFSGHWDRNSFGFIGDALVCAYLRD